ncbi:glycosyltransferase [Persicitalea jodogahamensis]|uniref:Uncharacterized protein n=1 Tax=Persicitalea jodogahamensis TaxID=402147 RepID=A0A8J3G7R9_9BACT|nr:glycosyltransferase family 1 protein [Persicitalea jodogahamensis]GHB59251.1 hypothetical protein GCM10007390_11140 [Persicitalea jodogahamensis]
MEENFKELKYVLVKRDAKLYGYPTSFDVLREFEDTIENQGAHVNTIYNNSRFVPLLYKSALIKLNVSLPNIIPQNKRSARFCSVQMGPDFGKILPYCSKNSATYAYFFDIWPQFFGVMEKFLKKSGITHVFVSSSVLAEKLKSKGYDNVSWIPEGVNSESYRYLAYENKDIDVLELGRKHQTIHEKIKNHLNLHGRKHIYEKIKGKIIFSDQGKMIQGMARSKISICFPKSETHPQLAGPISTMTNRYLQSMASKCLVVGTMPEEMKQLFGYEPVVTLDQKDPALHLENILINYSSYFPLIEKNYKAIVEQHTWENRWHQMLKVME